MAGEGGDAGRILEHGRNEAEAAGRHIADMG